MLTSRSITALLTSTMMLLSLNSAANEGSDEGWIVPEKRISPAKTLSEPIRVFLANLGAPAFEQQRNAKFETREQWQQFVAAMIAANPMTMEQHEKEYKVAIETSEIAGVTVHTVDPSALAPAFKDKVFLHVHGGGYFIGGGAMAAKEASVIASTSNIKVISIDYTLSTEKPFPAALNDVVAVYQEVLKTVPAASIGMGGTSAGGGLTLATTHQLKALKLPVPGALFAGTPSADFLATGDTWQTFEGLDNILVTHDGMLDGAFKLYAGDHDLKNPLISPLYGDFSGFPPTYLVSGTRDMLLSDTVRVHRKLRDAGAVADLNVFDGLPHGAYMDFQDTPEFEGTFGDLRKFLKAHLVMGK